jgi:hypothetical protein
MAISTCSLPKLAILQVIKIENSTTKINRTGDALTPPVRSLDQRLYGQPGKWTPRNLTTRW